MASNAYRNGAPRASAKFDRLVVAGANQKTVSFISRVLPSQSPGSVLRRSSPASLTARNGDGVPGRVRVAVRLRPQNAEEMVTDADFADCVELQPELKRLKLWKNNWVSDTYEFDEVFTEFASQKRVYEVVAKPVVELYMETLQDLLDPTIDSIPIVEDPRTGDISLPGATVIEIRDQQSFLELLRIGEAQS